MKRAVVLMAIAAALSSPGGAAELAGITLPDSQSVGGDDLRLNGIALRTYSIFRIPIYVAGLYLVHPDSDPDRILRAGETKLLDIRFIHDVSEESARKAWHEGFEQNCFSPCRLARADVERFIAGVHAMSTGDSFRILFTADGTEITSNGHAVASIPGRPFATAILATFIGPQPPTARLKRELLGPRLETSGR